MKGKIIIYSSLLILLSGSMCAYAEGTVSIKDHALALYVSKANFPVDRTDDFNTNDARVISWIEILHNDSKDHKLTRKWYSPGGDLYSTYTSNILRTSVSDWCDWAWIDISDIGENNLGQWRVDIYLDDAQKLLTEDFTIRKSG